MKESINSEISLLITQQSLIKSKEVVPGNLMQMIVHVRGRATTMEVATILLRSIKWHLVFAGVINCADFNHRAFVLFELILCFQFLCVFKMNTARKIKEHQSPSDLKIKALYF